MGMQNKRILVVEDEAPIRDMLRFALERADFRISLAGDVPEARLRIAESRPDLILLDWMMPGVSGIEFTVDQRVKKGFCFFASHFVGSCSAIQADRSMVRARARRDITVPTGASMMSAIWRYERL